MNIPPRSLTRSFPEISSQSFFGNSFGSPSRYFSRIVAGIPQRILLEFHLGLLSEVPSGMVLKTHQKFPQELLLCGFFELFLSAFLFFPLAILRGVLSRTPPEVFSETYPEILRQLFQNFPEYSFSSSFVISSKSFFENRSMMLLGDFSVEFCMGIFQEFRRNISMPKQVSLIIGPRIQPILTGIPPGGLS